MSWFVRGLRAVSACVVTVVAVSACGSSAATSGSSNSATNGSASSSAAASAPSASSTGAKADAATFAAVSHAYQVFFDYHTSSATATSLLQHGTQLRALVVAEAKTAAAQKPSAVVNSVSLVSPHVATVIWTLSIGGSPTLPNTSGYAVNEGGTWKVAAQTFCALVSLSGVSPAVCKDSAITALS